jgi:calcium-dependent protein kinase
MKSRELTITPGTFVKLRPPDRILDYEKIEKIGSGTFSDVYLCRHSPTGTLRALKVTYKAGLSRQQKDSQMLLQEIQILKMLDHPNILKCYEVFEDKSKYYLALEYCQRGDLYEKILEMKGFDEGKASKILFQILSAISHCHEKGIIHRDLKPENIFLVENGNEIVIKIGDFGSACVIKNTASVKGFFGSSYYFAPEVLEGDYDCKSDIWSIGIIMYIILTGKAPYEGRSNKQILHEIKKHPFQLTFENSSPLSPSSSDLLSKFLTINSKSRISALEALQHPWIQKQRSFNSTSLMTSLSSLRRFHCDSKLKEAVGVYITSQIASHAELKEIQKVFHNLDKDGNGKITRDELIEEYSKNMNFSQAAEVAEKIIKELDQDNDGNIDYTEFVVSCRNELKNVVCGNLEKAFKLFDADGNGVITALEIKMVLGDGQQEDEGLWKELLDEGDLNRDGVIDFNEFVKFIGKFNT